MCPDSLSDGPNRSLPLYQRLFERYKEEICSFRRRPGDRIESINELQKIYGIGRETAKRVLAMLAAEGLIVQRRGRGSFVADRTVVRRLGLLVPHYSIQYEGLIYEIKSCVTAVQRELHHYCHYNNYQEEIRLVGKMIQEGYEAVAVVPSLDEQRSWQSFYCSLPATRTSVVLLDHTMSYHDFAYVVQSYDLGVTRAVLYLMAQKTGAVAFVENELWPGRNMVLELMRGTYLELMRTRRPEHQPIVVPRAGALDVAELMARGVTGVFCCDDIAAIQVIGQFTQQGLRVPEQVNVVSYGNTPLSRYFTPPISSVDPRYKKMAGRLCQLVFGEDRAGPQQHVVSPDLVLRAT
jgi:DNA-binding LacI/PurR family transcriptional regulator